MICPSCGRECNDEDRYCGACGASLLKRCCKCGKQFSTVKQYCPFCGMDNSDLAIQLRNQEIKTKQDNKKSKVKKILRFIIILIFVLFMLFVFKNIYYYFHDKKAFSEQQIFIGQVLQKQEPTWNHYGEKYNDDYSKSHNAYLALKKNGDQTVSYYIMIDNKFVVANEKYNDMLVKYCHVFFANSYSYKEREELEKEFLECINSDYFEYIFAHSNFIGLSDGSIDISKLVIYTEPYKEKFDFNIVERIKTFFGGGLIIDYSFTENDQGTWVSYPARAIGVTSSNLAMNPSGHITKL